MTLAACRRFLERPLAGDENERWILAVALDAIEEEFRGLDRVEVACSDQPSDRRGGALFKVLEHTAMNLRPCDGSAGSVWYVGPVELSDRGPEAGPRRSACAMLAGRSRI